MRPLSLAIEGFGTFRERVDIDFSDVEFFALVGPTGAGKSTVIDAICFALYGFVPRYGNQSLVAPAVTLGAQQARVSLSFSVADTQYIATRVVRRTSSGGATTKEARLERLVTGGESEVLAGDARGMDPAVVALLGLEPAQFTRCVVLPQGEFMRFLHDKPADRQQLLVRLLGLDRYGEMARRARSRGSESKSLLAAKQGQLTDLSGATEEAEAAAASRVDVLKALRTRVDKAQKHVAGARSTVEAAVRALEESNSLLARLKEVKPPANIQKLGTHIATLRKALEQAEAQEALAQTACLEAESAREAAGDPTLAHAALSARRQLDVAESKLPDAATAASASSEIAAAAALALKQLDAELENTNRRLRETENAHAAHTLASRLTIGAPCPVCAVRVTVLPPITAPDDLAEITSAKDRLTKDRTAVEAADRTRAAEAAAAKYLLDNLTAQAAACRLAVTDERSEDALAAEVERLTGLADTARDLRHKADTARQELTIARMALNELDEESRKVRDGFTAARDKLGALTPPVPTDDIAADWRALAEFAAEKLTEISELAEQRRVALFDAEQARDTLIDSLRDGAKEQGVATAKTFEQLVSSVADAHATARGALDRLRTDRATADRLRSDSAELESTIQVAEDIARLLSANGFEAWVLQEALAELIAGASQILHELSSGAYSLGINEQRDFVVVDHREADAVRPARTLSGGETFQASLALALALADHLAEFAVAGMSKLESIFLDEGFGTLDEDSLDVVASTLESLASGSRVVGVITHVKELAARVPVRYEVRRLGRTATVEKVIS